MCQEGQCWKGLRVLSKTIPRNRKFKRKNCYWVSSDTVTIQPQSWHVKETKSLILQNEAANFSSNNVRTVSLKENGISDNESFFNGGNRGGQSLEIHYNFFSHFLSIAAHWIICGTSKALIILITPTFASREAPWNQRKMQVFLWQN